MLARITDSSSANQSAFHLRGQRNAFRSLARPQSRSLLVLWPVSRAKVFPLLFLCVIPLGLFALVVFNRWRICRELRELAWQEWHDSVSPIARRCGIESAVIRLSDRWRNY